MNVRRALCLTAVAAALGVGPAGTAWAIQTPTTGQPGTTAGVNCATSTAMSEPGKAMNAPGSAFNEAGPGIAGTMYAGNGPGSTAHAGSTAAVAQYDIACGQVSTH